MTDWPISKRTKTVLEKAGYFKLEDLPVYLDELKAVPGLGPTGVKEIREWCYQKFGLKFKTRPKEKKKVLKNFKDSRLVLEHLLPGPKNWAKQLKIADALVARYGVDLLLKVTPNPKVFSLAWFASDYGDKYIRQFMSATVVKEEKVIEEEVEPCEFIPAVEKPKSLKDFLKL